MGDCRAAIERATDKEKSQKEVLGYALQEPGR